MYYTEAKKQELLDKYWEAVDKGDLEMLEDVFTELYEAYGISPGRS